MKTNKFLVLLGVVAFAFTSCDKTETLSVSQTENSALINEDQAIEVASTDVDAIADEALSLKSLTTLKSAEADSSNYLGTCPTLTVDTSKVDKVLTINFGTSCLGKDGKTRSGKIIVTSTNFSKVGVLRTISFANYTVNGDTVMGTIKKTLTQPVLGKRKAHIIDALTIHRAGNKGAFSVRTCDIYRVYDFNILRDSKLYTWGNAQFVNTKGVTINKTIAENKPLIFSFACRHVVSGIQVVVRGDKTLITDFGDGSCDDVATVTDGSKSWTIKL